MVNRLALAGIAVIFAAGAWLIAAPFVLRYQPAGRAMDGPGPAGRLRWLGAGRGRVRRLLLRWPAGQGTVRAGRRRSGAGRRAGVELGSVALM